MLDQSYETTWDFDLINLEEFNKFLKWKQKKIKEIPKLKQKSRKPPSLISQKGTFMQDPCSNDQYKL